MQNSRSLKEAFDYYPRLLDPYCSLPMTSIKRTEKKTRSETYSTDREDEVSNRNKCLQILSGDKSLPGHVLPGRRSFSYVTDIN